MADLPTECTTLQLSTLHDCSVCIIDISNNKSGTLYQELLECPICLDSISHEDPILILACCKNKVHIKCLCDWYNADRENITCFICNQSNPFGDNIMLPDDSNSSDDSSSVNTQSRRMRRQLLQRSSQERIESYQQCKTVITILVCTACLFVLIIGITLQAI